MDGFRSLDALVQARLRGWPQTPPGARGRSGRIGTERHDGWLRGRPGAELDSKHPFLKFPGGEQLRTLPDGLWLNFGGTPVEPFVDIFAIEACGSLQNLLDKRSRFAPSTQSLLAVCPVPWLMGPVMKGDETPRWKATGVLHAPPVAALVLPVRDLRVMYALKEEHYQGFATNQIPHPHEYFIPMRALIAEDAQSDPALRALVSRASARANFHTPPSESVRIGD